MLQMIHFFFLIQLDTKLPDLNQLWCGSFGVQILQEIGSMIENLMVVYKEISLRYKIRSTIVRLGVILRSYMLGSLNICVGHGGCPLNQSATSHAKWHGWYWVSKHMLMVQYPTIHVSICLIHQLTKQRPELFIFSFLHCTNYMTGEAKKDQMIVLISINPTHLRRGEKG